jgi:fructose-bisphosphate aldolase class II
MAFVSLRQLLDHAAVPGTHLVMHGSSSVPQEWLEIIRK